MNTSSSQGCTAGVPVARYGSRTCDPKVSEIFADTSRNGVARPENASSGWRKPMVIYGTLY